MSSNIRVLKICERCGNEFMARKTVTRFCTANCAKRAYKERQKEIKIKKSDTKTLKEKLKPIEEIKSKEFLSVIEAAKLIGCCKQTVYTLINSGIINGVNIKIKKTIIPRKEIDNLFFH